MGLNLGAAGAGKNRQETQGGRRRRRRKEGEETVKAMFEKV